MALSCPPPSQPLPVQFFVISRSATASAGVHDPGLVPTQPLAIKPTGISPVGDKPSDTCLPKNQHIAEKSPPAGHPPFASARSSTRSSRSRSNRSNSPLTVPVRADPRRDGDVRRGVVLVAEARVRRPRPRLHHVLQVVLGAAAVKSATRVVIADGDKADRWESVCLFALLSGVDLREHRILHVALAAAEVHCQHARSAKGHRRHGSSSYSCRARGRRSRRAHLRRTARLPARRCCQPRKKS